LRGTFRPDMDKDIIFVTCNSTPCTLMSLKIHPVLAKKTNELTFSNLFFI
jgi:hypothetical protein